MFFTAVSCDHLYSHLYLFLSAAFCAATLVIVILNGYSSSKLTVRKD